MINVLTERGSLQNKKIVIIGGSSGLGLAVAQSSAEKNAEVIILSGNHQKVNTALQLLPRTSTGFAVDVTRESELQEVFGKIGYFDHLVFTAGENLIINEIINVKMEEAKKYFDIRYWGAVGAVKYASPWISKSGSIVLTSGIANNRPNKGWSLGASICAAMEGFTRAMAMELAPVRVNIVSPGVVKTNLWSNMNEADREKMFEQIGNSLPVKRVGFAEDIAKAYVYLMEQEFGTGQTLIVDGGTSSV